MAGRKSDEKDRGYQISHREQLLRERLLTVDEDLVRAETRLRQKGEARRRKLAAKINRARSRQEAKLDRRDKSRLYHRARPLYYLLCPVFAVGCFFRSVYRWACRKTEHHRHVSPHRSFYLTTHAQAVRQINISGYGRFVTEVWRMVRDNWLIYLKITLLMALAIIAVVGVSNAHSNYVDTREAMEKVDLHPFLKQAGLVTQAIITSLTVTDANRQAATFIIVAVAWLSLIFIARRVYSGNQLRLRDAIYSAGTPLVPMIVLLIAVLVQLLPLALVLISYSAITGAGYINQGVAIENMAAWCVILAVLVLTIYWMVTSLLTLVSVTIPGLYPMRAYYETSIQVAGRRVKILLRILMMFLPLLVLWALVLIPTVLLDSILKPKTFPVVQLVVSLLAAISCTWVSAYMYVLYRRILDSPEQPVGTIGRVVWPWQRRKLVKPDRAKANKDSGKSHRAAKAGKSASGADKSDKQSATKR